MDKFDEDPLSQIDCRSATRSIYCKGCIIQQGHPETVLARTVSHFLLSKINDIQLRCLEIRFYAPCSFCTDCEMQSVNV